MDAAKIKRAQKALKAKMGTETIDRALDSAITGQEKNRLVRETRERFFASGLEIPDVDGLGREERSAAGPESKRFNGNPQGAPWSGSKVPSSNQSGDES